MATKSWLNEFFHFPKRPQEGRAFAGATATCDGSWGKRMVTFFCHNSHSYINHSFLNRPRQPVKLEPKSSHQKVLRFRLEKFVSLTKCVISTGEQKASRALREASEIIGDSPAALQLRYLQVEKQTNLCHTSPRDLIWKIFFTLQTLNTISAEKNSTIIFPLPIDMMTFFMRKSERNERKAAREGA